jgi:DNA-binding transcriptional MerR regulator
MNPPEHLDNDHENTSDLLPIGEVAAITGVNPVTLRAWERRYGLIVPQRTSKGHRLYSVQQVAGIQHILAWLKRGVSVGQVKALLAHDQPLPGAPLQRWQDSRERLLCAIQQLDRHALEHAYKAEQSTYPPQILCQHLLQPLLQHLEQRHDPGSHSQQLFFHTWLRSRLGAWVQHSKAQQQGQPLLLVNLDATPLSVQLWLCAWLIAAAGCRVECFDGAIPAAELEQCIALLRPRALLLFRREHDPQSLRPWLRNQNLPCLLITPDAGMPLQQAQEEQVHIERVTDALQAMQLLADRHWLEKDNPCCN